MVNLQKNSSISYKRTPQNNASINLHWSVDICHSVLSTSETKCDSLLNYYNLC